MAVDLSKISSHLWESANILRRPVDAADFKTYIFPLLLFKRLSDVYDVYQHLMDYWAETMQDDCYLIADAGWIAGVKPREIVQVKNKENKLVWPVSPKPSPAVSASSPNATPPRCRKRSVWWPNWRPRSAVISKKWGLCYE